MRHFIIAISTTLGASMPLLPLAAQEWHVSAQTGRIRSALDPASSESIALGLQYDDPTAGLRLSGGIPLRSNDMLRGGASAWKRLFAQHRGVLAGIDLSGSAFGAVDRSTEPAPTLPDPIFPSPSARMDRSGHAFAGQIMPVIGYEHSLVQLQARAGVSRYSATFNRQAIGRSVQLADAQVSVTPTPWLAIVPVMRRFRASGEEASTFTGLSAIAASTPGAVWASIGQWTGGVSGGAPWSAGGRLSLHGRVSLDASVRRDTYDPLYLQPAQTSWSIGLSVLLSRQARAVAPAVPAAYTDGRATIRLPVSKSKMQPSIAGDFNSWKPAPMTRDGDHWTYTVAVRQGVYNYAFVATDGTWYVPEGVPGRKDDGMGGHVAVLVVR